MQGKGYAQCKEQMSASSGWISSTDVWWHNRNGKTLCYTM